MIPPEYIYRRRMLIASMESPLYLLNYAYTAPELTGGWTLTPGARGVSYTTPYGGGDPWEPAKTLNRISTVGYNKLKIKWSGSSGNGVRFALLDSFSSTTFSIAEVNGIYMFRDVSTPGVSSLTISAAQGTYYIGVWGRNTSGSGAVYVEQVWLEV